MNANETKKTTAKRTMKRASSGLNMWQAHKVGGGYTGHVTVTAATLTGRASAPYTVEWEGFLAGSRYQETLSTLRAALKFAQEV